MTQGSDQEPTRPRRPLPTNYVIGVIDQLQEAEQAVQTLQDDGYTTQDILLIPSQAFIEAMQQRQQQTSSFEKKAHAFFTSSDDGFPADLYLQHAKRGAQVLAVYASTIEQAQRIVQALRKHPVHLLKYFSRWTTTDFPVEAK